MAEDEQTQGNDEQAAENLRRLMMLVIHKLQNGITDRTVIAAQLADELEIEEQLVAEMVDAVYEQCVATVEEDRLKSTNVLEPQSATPGTLFLGLIGGILGATIAAGIWLGIAVATGYEIGFIAIGIGAISGLGVMLFTGAETGVAYQILAILSSIYGIMLSKYGLFVYYLIDYLETEEQASNLSFFSTLFNAATLSLFRESLNEYLGGYDILWIIIAAYAAWKMSSGRWDARN